MFYSGLPIAEEQRYTGSQFLPAVAGLKSKYATQRFGLQETLAKLTSDQYGQAYGVREKEVAADEDRRQFDERLRAQQAAEAANRAAASRASGGGAFSPSGGGGGGAVQGSQTIGRMAKKSGGGFAFADQGGATISAARYAQLNGIPIGSLLYSMGQSGDKYAAQLYNQIQANQGWFSNPANKAQISKTYAPIFWGT